MLHSKKNWIQWLYSILTTVEGHGPLVMDLLMSYTLKKTSEDGRAVHSFTQTRWVLWLLNLVVSSLMPGSCYAAIWSVLLKEGDCLQRRNSTTIKQKLKARSTSMLKRNTYRISGLLGNLSVNASVLIMVGSVKNAILSLRLQMLRLTSGKK